MCLAVPGRIVSVFGDGAAPEAEIDYAGTRRRASLVFLPEVGPGDWVVVQAGFAVRRLSEAEARETLELTASAETPAVSSAG